MLSAAASRTDAAFQPRASRLKYKAMVRAMASVTPRSFGSKPAVANRRQFVCRPSAARTMVQPDETAAPATNASMRRLCAEAVRQNSHISHAIASNCASVANRAAVAAGA